MCWQFSMLVTYQQNDVLDGLNPEVAIKPNEKQKPFKTQQIIKSRQNSNLKPSVQLQLFFFFWSSNHRRRLTWDDARFLALLQCYEVVGVAAAAAVFELLAASRAHVVEKSVLDGPAWPWIRLHGAQLVENDWLWSMVCGWTNKVTLASDYLKKNQRNCNI